MYYHCVVDVFFTKPSIFFDIDATRPFFRIQVIRQTKHEFQLHSHFLNIASI